MLRMLRRQIKRTVRDRGSNSRGEGSLGSVNKVKRDPFSPSRSRSKDKRNSPTWTKKRCFRCGLTNHSPDSCNNKTSECFHHHQRGYLQSECHNTKLPRKKRRPETARPSRISGFRERCVGGRRRLI